VKRSRIYLSPPHLGEHEQPLLADAIASNWIAPLGPHVDAFERELAARVGVRSAAALSSGTAALHLALVVLGVEAGSDVLVSDLSFVAPANAIRYVGARPVLVDCDTASWNMDPALLAEELSRRATTNELPAAVIVVDIYGQCADYDAIRAACDQYDVPIIEDAAEALGATYRGRSAGSFGKLGVFSFNGNKIITTSGGGMLVSDDPDLIDRTRYLSTQAREPRPEYHHVEVGYNYRLSNLLAAIGRGQLRALDQRVAERRRVHDFYRSFFEQIPGVTFMPEASYGACTRWLTCIQVEESEAGVNAEQIREHLERHDIESRPVWKPLHLQPVFEDCQVVGGSTSERLYTHGLCLPSGSSLSAADLQRIGEALSEVLRR
jgi:pyridoxal phosphate-dependent aminotransferase EpsN